MELNLRTINTRSQNSAFSVLVKFFTGNIEGILFTIIIFLKLSIFNEALNMKNYSVFEYSCLGSVIIVLSFSLLFKRKTRIYILFFMDVIISAIILSNIIYYRYYSDVISIPVLFQVSLVDPALKSSIFNLIKLGDIKFVIDIFILLIFIIFIFKKVSLECTSAAKNRVMAAFLIFIFGIGLSSSGFINLKKVIGGQPISKVFDHSLILENTGMLNFYNYDVWYFFSNKFFSGGKVDHAELEKMKATMLSKSTKSQNKVLNNVAKGKNLIVIQVESMQNIVINMKVDGREVTPNLNRFLKRSIYFNNYYTQVGQGNTADAEFISNNSFYALPEGAVYFRYVNNKFDSLPKQLRTMGYSTAAMHAYKASFWNRATIYPAMGFQKFFSQKDYNLSDSIGWWGLTDKSFLKQSAEKMKQMAEPFYSFLITLSSHYPYESFKNNQYGNEFDAGTYNGTFFGDYLKAMHYSDESLGVFLEELEKNRLIDRSVIAIYGDHEGMKKSDLESIRKPLGLSSNEDLAFLAMKNIPLIIHLPKDTNAGKREIVGGQVDLLPTLANLLGINPRYYFGQDLINAKSGVVIFRNGNVTDGKYVYLKGSNEYLDIQNGKKINSVAFENIIVSVKKEMNISDSIIENNGLKSFGN